MTSIPIDIFNKLSIGLILVDKKQKIFVWNHWMENKTQLQAESVFGKQFSEVCPKFKELNYKKMIDTVIETGQGRFLSGALHGPFFDYLPSEAALTIQNLQIEQIILEDRELILIQVNDITSQYHTVHQMKSFIKNLEVENEEIRQAESEAREMAIHDELTGLPNRINFINHLKEIVKSQNSRYYNTAVIFLDIDDFKNINDTYGHLVGDTLLKMTAKRLKAAVHSTDFVARLSGDEFTLLLYAISSKDHVTAVANRIMAQFMNPFDINGLKISVTCSFGISMFPFDGTDAVSLLHKADTALYRVKNNKKSGYQFY
jgi:diguanylate cyclase